MDRFLNRLQSIFTGGRTIRILAIELCVIVLLLGILFAVSADIQIQLQGENVLTVEVGDVFQDPGAVAMMDGKALDVKVSGEVDTTAPGTYTLCYKARYLLSSKTIYRTVEVVKAEKPTIRLTDGNEITITMCPQFQEPGFRATDKEGRDITDRVEVIGTVDSMTEGTYRLTYRVTDDGGRTAEQIRLVTVRPARQPDVVDPDGKVIYLTFDDGPGQYTQQLLDVLAKYNAKATFFVVNTSYSEKEAVMKNIVDGGHAIGIHSLTHQWSIYQSEDSFLEDLYGMQKVIEKATGVTTTLMRFPGGSSNTASKKYCAGIMTALTKKVTDLGFQYFDWNVDSNDAGGAKTADEVYQNVVNGIGNKKTAVVLMHDIKNYSVEAVEKILQWGLANGYTFQALTPESPVCHHQVNN